MMRMKGKRLECLNWKTDVIYLIRSAKPETDKKYLKDIMDGKFIG